HAARQDEPPDDVRESRGQPSRERVLPSGAHAAGEGGVIEQPEQDRNLVRWTLQIGVERRHELAACGPDSRGQGPGLPPRPREPQRPHAGSAGGERGEQRGRLVDAAVVDDDQLPEDAPRIERGFDRVAQADEIRRFVARGNDDAQRDARERLERRTQADGRHYHQYDARGPYHAPPGYAAFL